MIKQKVFPFTAITPLLLLAILTGCDLYNRIFSTAMNPPANLEAAISAPYMVELSWHDTIDGEDGFEIQRRTGWDGNFAIVGRTSANSESYFDTVPDADTLYFYFVRGTNKGVRSYKSNFAGVYCGAQGEGVPNQLTASGTVQGTAVDFSSDTVTVEFPESNPGNVKISANHGDAETRIGINYDALIEGETYGAEDIGLYSRMFLNIGSDLIAALASYDYFIIADGSLTVERYDGTFLHLSFSLVSDLGDSLEGELNLLFLPTDDPDFGDGVQDERLMQAPSSLAASEVTYASVSLEWIDNSNNDYEIHVSRKRFDETVFDGIAVLDGDATQYIDTDVDSSTEYSYRVVSVGDNGWSMPSDDLTITTESAGSFSASGTVFGQVVDIDTVDPLVSIFLGETSELRIGGRDADGIYSGIAFDYTQVKEGETYIDAEIDESSPIRVIIASDIIVEGLGGQNSFAPYGAISISKYDQTGIAGSYRLYSDDWFSDIILEGDFDVRFSQTNDPNFGIDGLTAVGYPSAPTSFSLENISQTSVTLVWIDNATDETGFEISRKTTLEGDFEVIATLPADSVSYIDENARSGIAYLYRIRSINDSGPSKWSREKYLGIEAVDLFTATGTINGTTVNIETNQPVFGGSIPANFITIGGSQEGGDLLILLNYLQLLEGATYTDQELHITYSPVSFLVSGSLLPEEWVYTQQGSLTIDRYDGYRIAGSYDITTTSGFSLAGSFDVQFTPENDPLFGQDGLVPGEIIDP